MPPLSEFKMPRVRHAKSRETKTRRNDVRDDSSREIRWYSWIRYGHLDEIDHVLETASDVKQCVNMVDHQFRSPLFFALRYATPFSDQIVQKLLEAGAEPFGECDLTPSLAFAWRLEPSMLHYESYASAFLLVAMQDRERFQPLITHLLQNLIGAGMVPWRFISLHPEVLQECLDLGLDVNATDVDGYSAAHWFVVPHMTEKHVAELVTLLEHGLDLRAEACTGTVMDGLALDVESGQISSVQVDALLVMLDYDSALVESLATLLVTCEKLAPVLRRVGALPLTIASVRCTSYVESCLETILETLDVNAEDDQRRTMLFYVTCPVMARFLLGKGADPSHQDKDGNTALGFHATTGDASLDVIRVLLGAGATQVVNHRGVSPYGMPVEWVRHDLALQWREMVEEARTQEMERAARAMDNQECMPIGMLHMLIEYL
jgi:hypothetical protein